MPVIGNDLVQIKNIDNQRTFMRPEVRRFFSYDELRFADDHLNSNPLLCIWAMKESAYKCIMKLGVEKSFSPAKFQNKLYQEGSWFCSEVKYDGHVLHTRCIEDGEYVRCVASDDILKLSSIRSLHVTVGEYDNTVNKIINRIEKINNHEELFIVKGKHNIPNIFNAEATHKMEISLSNEGGLYYVSVLPEWIVVC